MQKLWRLCRSPLSPCSPSSWPACGGGGEQEQHQRQQHNPEHGGQEGRHGHGPRLRRDVDSLDPGYWYYQYDYMALGHDRPSGGCTRWKPDGQRRRRPTSPTGLPQVSDGGKTLTIKIKPGIKYSPPLAEPDGQGRGHQVRDGARFLPQVGQRLRGAYYSDIVGAKRLRGRQGEGDLAASRRRTTRRSSSSSTGRRACSPTATRWRCRHGPGAEGSTRRSTTQGKQSTYGQHQVFTGPYMIESDGDGKVRRRLPARASSSRWCATRAGTRRPTSGRPTSTRSSSRAATTSPSPPPDPHGPAACMSGDFAAPPPAILKQALTTEQDPAPISPSRGIRYIALNTTVKPFDNVNVRKAVVGGNRQQRPAADARRPGDRDRSPPTSSRRSCRASRRPAEEAGPGLDFTSNPNGDLALAASYMKKAGYPSGKYTGPPLLMVGRQPAAGAEDRRGAPDAAREARLQAQLPPGPARDDAREVLRRAEGERRRSARTSAGARTSSTRSR